MGFYQSVNNSEKIFNTVKIVIGIFAYNSHLSVLQNVLNWVSNLTWQAPQEAVGLTTSVVQNTLGGVDKVKYFDGATVLMTTWLAKEIGGGGGAAFTLGKYISAPNDIGLCPNDPLLQHEYGRFLQSKAQGLAYLTFTAIPDVFSPGNDNPTAWDGNARALKYFNKYYGGVYTNPTEPTGNVYWNLRENFINGYNISLPVNDPYKQAALDRGIRSPG